MPNYLTARGSQLFVITIASGSTTGTASISSVGSGAFILHDGINPSVATNPAEDFARVTLTNATTVTATRNTGTAGTIVITGYVVDGDINNLIKSVQFGTITLTGVSSNTATISPVINNNTAYHLLGWSSTNTTYSGINEHPSLSLSGTTLTATRGGTTGNITVNYVIIEFQGAALAQSVQNVSATSSSSVTSFTAAISAVTLANTMMFYAGSRIATSTTNLANIKMRGSLTSTTQVTVNVNTGVANAKTYNCCVVSFVSGVLNSAVQRNTTTLTGTTSNTTNLSTQVNTSFAALSFLGNSTSVTTAQLGEAEGNAQISTVSVGGPGLVQDSTNGSPAFGYTASPNSTGLGSKGSNSATGIITTLTVTASYTGGISNSLILVCVQVSFGVTVSSVTDTAGNTYTHLTAADSTQAASSGLITQFWYKQNPSVSITQVVVAVTGTVSASTCAAATFGITGVASSPIDNTASISNHAAATSIVSAAVTTTNPCCLIFQAPAANRNSFGSFSPFWYFSATNIGNLEVVYRVTSGGTQSEQLTWSTTSQAYGVSTVAIAGNPPIPTTNNYTMMLLNPSTAGNLIAVCVNTMYTSTYSDAGLTITDDKSQTYTLAASASYTGAGGGTSYIFYVQNTAGGALNITISATGNFVMDGELFEISGLPTTGSVIDTTGTVTNQSTSTTTITGPAITTTNSADFILSYFGNQSTQNYINNVNAPYTEGSGQSGYQITSSTVTSQAVSASLEYGTTQGYAIATVAFKGTSTLVEVVLVSKATSTGNITASWEVLEFPAYNPGLMSARASIMTFARAAPTPTAYFSARTSAQIKLSANINATIPVVSLQGLCAMQVKAFGAMSPSVALSGMTSIQVKSKSNPAFSIIMQALTAAQIKAQALITTALSSAYQGIITVQVKARAMMILTTNLSGRTNMQVKANAMPSNAVSVFGRTAAQIKAFASASLYANLYGRTSIQIQAKSGISLFATMAARTAVAVKGSASAKLVLLMAGRITSQTKAALGSMHGFVSMQGLTAIMVTGRSRIATIIKFTGLAKIMTFAAGMFQLRNNTKPGRISITVENAFPIVITETVSYSCAIETTKTYKISIGMEIL